MITRKRSLYQNILSCFHNYSWQEDNCGASSAMIRSCEADKTSSSQAKAKSALG